MTCSTLGCGKQAKYRTCGPHDVIALLCVGCMERARDKGWKDEDLVAIRA